MRKSLFFDIETGIYLYIVRILSNLGLRIKPISIIVLISIFTATICLFIAALFNAFGATVILELQKQPDSFELHNHGITNSIDAILTCSLPLILISIGSISQIFGWGKTEPWLQNINHKTWQALRLTRSIIVITYEILPKLPKFIIALALSIEACTLPVTFQERRIGIIIIFTSIAIEGLRVKAISNQLEEQTNTHNTIKLKHLLKSIPAILFGITLGTITELLWNVTTQKHFSSKITSFILGQIAQHATALLLTSVLLSVACWILTLSRLRFPNFAPTQPSQKPAIKAPNFATLVFHPITHMNIVFRIWCCEEIRYTLAAVAFILATPSICSQIPDDVIIIVAVSVAMAFCVTRLIVAGPTLGLLRWREHVEMGARPSTIWLRSLLCSFAAALPEMTALTIALTLAGINPSYAIGVNLAVFASTLLADALIARPQRQVSERKLMLLAILQTVCSISSLAVFSLFSPAGYGLILFMIGAAKWLTCKRMNIWTPSLKW